MLLFKKLLFAPVFLIFFFLTVYFLIPFIGKTDILLSLDMSILWKYVFLAVCTFFTGLFFVIFASLAGSWKYVVPVVVVASLIPLIFGDPALYILSVVTLVIFLILFWNLWSTLKVYLSFQPNMVLGRHVRGAGKLLLLVLALTYLLSVKSVIDKNGYQVPDSLIETALKFSPLGGDLQPVAPAPGENPQSTPTSLPKISTQQINELKQHPELLQQFGIDPKTLDTLLNPPTPANTTSNTPATPSQAGIDNLVKTEIQGILSPYQSYIPFFLTALFLGAAYTLYEIVALLTAPLLWLIFEVLEELRFIRFEVEQREVKKMVV